MVYHSESNLITHCNELRMAYCLSRGFGKHDAGGKFGQKAIFDVNSGFIEFTLYHFLIICPSLHSYVQPLTSRR